MTTRSTASAQLESATDVAVRGVPPGLRLALLTAGASLLLPGCGAAAGVGTPAAGHRAGSATTVSGVYALAGSSLRAAGRGGRVSRVRIRRVTHLGAISIRSTTRLWIDTGRHAARQQTTSVASRNHRAGPPETSVTLIAHGITWQDGHPVEPTRCHHADTVASLLLGCPPTPQQTRAQSVRSGTFRGRPVTVLTSDLSFTGSDQTTRSTRTAFLTRETGLPLADRETGSYDNGRVRPLKGHAGYRSTVLDRAVLPADFFEPSALGWTLPDPEADLPAGVPIAWLGRTFRPGPGLPAVVFATVDPGVPDLYTAILNYTPARHRFGPRTLMLTEMTPAQFANPHRVPQPMPCAGPALPALPGAVVTLSCNRRHTDARVRLDDLVLEVHPIDQGLPGQAASPSPLRSRAAMVRVLRGLRIHTG